MLTYILNCQAKAKQVSVPHVAQRCYPELAWKKLRNKAEGMTVAVNNVQRNRILNAMTNADLCLLQPHLEAVPLKFRQRLAGTAQID